MKRLTIGGAVIVGSLSLLSLGVLPILLGGLEEAGQLTKAGVGQAAMFELFGLALGAAAGGYWMARGALRLKVVSAALGLCAINLATAHADGAAIVLSYRAMAGLLAGLIFGAANAVIIRSRAPDRFTGVLVAGSVIPQIALAYLIPAVLAPRFGAHAGFYAVAAGIGAAAVVATVLVDKLSPLAEPRRTGGTLTWPWLVFAGALVLQSCGLGAMWTYAERLADQHGFSPSIAGIAIAASLTAQVVAGWLSAWLAPRVATWPALLLLASVQTGSVTIAVLADIEGTFVASMCMVGGAAAAMQAFQVAGILVLDPTRRTAVLVGPMILFGNGLGSLLASFATTNVDVRGGAWAAAAMSGVSVLLYGVSALQIGRATTSIDPNAPIRP